MFPLSSNSSKSLQCVCLEDFGVTVSGVRLSWVPVPTYLTGLLQMTKAQYMRSAELTSRHVLSLRRPSVIQNNPQYKKYVLHFANYKICNFIYPERLSYFFGEQNSNSGLSVCLCLFPSSKETSLIPVLCQDLGLRPVSDASTGLQFLDSVGTGPLGLLGSSPSGSGRPRAGLGPGWAGVGEGSSLAGFQAHSEPTRGKPQFYPCQHAWGRSTGDIKY